MSGVKSSPRVSPFVSGVKSSSLMGIFLIALAGPDCFVFSGFFRKRLAKGMPRQIVPPLIAALIDQWILGFLLNTYFISVLYGSSFKGLLAVRSVQAAIMCVVQAILLYVLQKILMRPDIRKVLSRQH